MAERKAKGLALISGGLDSQLGVCVLRSAGCEMEGVTFATPFFAPTKAIKAAETLKLKLHIVDFTDDEIALIKHPPHGFGGAMNPCIDCHAMMIRRAGELMGNLGFDFVSTGEVLNQRPMSQNRQSLSIVARDSGLEGRLLRPLSAKLLDETIPEKEGLIDRSALLDIEGRCRQRQIELAESYGLVDYPAPAGGCKLTESGFGRRLRDLLEHEGLDDRRLVELLNHGRRFRLENGASVILGRDAADNALIEKTALPGEMLVMPVTVAGPTALVIGETLNDDLIGLGKLVASYSQNSKFAGDITVSFRRDDELRNIVIPRPYDREEFRRFIVM